MILITGGAGYIGSHVNKLLNQNGYETVVVDNLVYGHESFVKWGTFINADVTDEAAMMAIFEKYPIDLVMHFAAFAYVGESVHMPAKYYRNNVVGAINLLDCMRRAGCDKLVFSSTCATYGIPEILPIDESSAQIPINPYGASKLMIERIIRDYSAAYGLNYYILRYFNAAGADPDGEIGEWHEPETHLIPLVLRAALDKSSPVRIYGTDYDTPDGTCLRDYVHVSDLAQAHLLAGRRLLDGGDNDCFNLGAQRGLSVNEIIVAAREITKVDIPAIKEPRRSGDPPILIAKADKAKNVLGWKPVYSNCETILTHAWNWQNKIARHDG